MSQSDNWLHDTRDFLFSEGFISCLNGNNLFQDQAMIDTDMLDLCDALYENDDYRPVMIDEEEPDSETADEFDDEDDWEEIEEEDDDLELEEFEDEDDEDFDDDFDDEDDDFVEEEDDNFDDDEEDDDVEDAE